MNKDIVNVLGVKLNNLSRDEIEEGVGAFLAGVARQKFLITLNPEIALKGHFDHKYREILNTSDFCVCDGIGIRLISFLKRNRVKARYTGVDLTKYILSVAEKRGLRVLVVAAGDSLSKPEEIKTKVGQVFSGSVSVKYFDSNIIFDSEDAKSAEIVFVNFGAPRQEKFIHANRHKFPNARVLVGVGGTFDFLTGRVKRAPKIWRQLGFEWLWRLIQEPKRIGRIWRAVVVFPVLSMMNNE